MELTLKNLTLGKEKVYFAVILAISLIAWIILTITVIGLVYALLAAAFIWFANGLFVAHLKSEAVLVNEQQLPELYSTYKEVCEQLGVTKMPELYVTQAGGALNAFATRHAERNFVTLFSDIVESYGQSSDEIRFLLGHELGHIKNRHILKRLFLFPGLILPLLGPAYNRACETSCDYYGSFVAKNMDGALRAMMVLSGGKHIGKTMSPQTFSEQYKNHRGFFVSWHELISGYPTFSQRVANLIAIKEKNPLPKYSRNPFAYLFALFSFGGPASGGSFITIAIIAFLAAIAIPNLLRARLTANDSLAKTTLTSMSEVVQNYVETYNVYPSSVNELNDSPYPYLFKYCQQTVFGYKYKCEFFEDDYKFEATPIEIGVTGSGVCTANKDGLFCNSNNS